MIDLSNHNEDLIRDARTWKPLNVYPLERVMVRAAAKATSSTPSCIPFQ